jgi:predicted proteasome-type protease
LRSHLGEDDPYLVEIGQRWHNGMGKLVNEMPGPDFSKPAWVRHAA